MKSSEYYEHQLNEEQLRSDQLQDQIDTLKCQLDDLRAERKELMETLRRLVLSLEDGDFISEDCDGIDGLITALKVLNKSSETP